MTMISLSPVAATTAAKLFRGLSDPTRLSILIALVDSERRVVDLVDEVGTAQSNVSAHLACLRDCGLVESRPEGRQNFYRIAQPGLLAFLRSAEAVLESTGHDIDLCPNYQEPVG